MNKSDLSYKMGFLRLFAYQMLRDYFYIQWVSATQVKCGFGITPSFTTLLPEQWQGQLVGKEFTLDTAIVGYNGIIDLVSKRSSNFYSVYAMFDTFWNFLGVGLVECNKSSVAANVTKQDAAQQLTITGGGSTPANLWDTNPVPVVIWQDATHWLIGLARRYSSTQLEITMANSYGATTSAASIIYQITGLHNSPKQVPYDVNGNIVGGGVNWLWFTSGIRIDSGGNIEGGWYYRNGEIYVLPDNNVVWRKISDVTTAWVTYNLNELMSPATESFQFFSYLYNNGWLHIKDIIYGYDFQTTYSNDAAEVGNSRNYEVMPYNLINSYSLNNATNKTIGFKSYKEKR